jgi:hypothetical protein
VESCVEYFQLLLLNKIYVLTKIFG